MQTDHAHSLGGECTKKVVRFGEGQKLEKVTQFVNTSVTRELRWKRDPATGSVLCSVWFVSFNKLTPGDPGGP